MKIIPDIKATFGDTYYLGHIQRMKFDKESGRRTDEPDGYTCKISSSALQGSVDITVPLTAQVDKLDFNQRVTLQGVTIDPYAKSAGSSSFAQLVLRCTASAIIPDTTDKHVFDRNTGVK